VLEDQGEFKMTDVAFITSAEIQHVPLPASPQIPDAVARACDPQLPAPAQRRRRRSLPPVVLRRVRQHIDANLEKTINFEEMAGMAGLSKSHFAHAFRRSQGVTPHGYLLRRRLRRVQQLLADTDLPLSEVAIACGFADQSHCLRRFKERPGITPRRYLWLRLVSRMLAL
jgi:transcriptional regulator GlxA family with amidase domain